MNRTVTLSAVVKKYLNEQGQDTLHSYTRLLQSAVTALEELEWDVTGVPIYRMCSKDSNGQIDFPTDCVQMIDIGVINHAGEFVSIEESENYAPRRSYDSSGTAINKDGGTRLNVPSNEGVSGRPNALSLNVHGESTGRLYGVSGHSGIAAYGYDELNKKINISTDSTVNEFMLIYLSNLQLVNGDIMVHPFMVEAIMSGMEWILARRLKSTSDGKSRSLHNKFATAKHQLSMRMTGGNYQILKAVSRHGTAAQKG